MFTHQFNKIACDGDTISCTKNGYVVTARIESDTDMGPPWKEHEGHGVVSDWRPYSSKRPGERVLNADGDACRFYDWSASIELAKRDGWDAPPYNTGTKGEQAERAVQRDFESLKAWCEDKWSWCGVVLSVSLNGVMLDNYAASLWGIALNHPHSEDGNACLTEVANELLDDALEKASKARLLMLAALTAE